VVAGLGMTIQGAAQEVLRSSAAVVVAVLAAQADLEEVGEQEVLRSSVDLEALEGVVVVVEGRMEWQVKFLVVVAGPQLVERLVLEEVEKFW